MHDRVTRSWRQLSDGLRDRADTRSAEVLPLHVREEWRLDAWEDDGGTVAIPPEPLRHSRPGCATADAVVVR